MRSVSSGGSRAVRRGSAAILVALACAAGVADGEDWPRFRGPNGSGIAATAVPVVFGADQHLAWQVALPGAGVSSPIVVGPHVLVTTYSGYGAGGGTQLDLVRHLVCIDRATGTVRWTRAVEAVLPEDPFSGMGVPVHGYASHTPASDGKRVYASFGKSGVHAFDLDGTPLWQPAVGTGSDPRQWGSASRPTNVRRR